MSNKAQLGRDLAMVAAAKASKEFIADEKLEDTRLSNQTKRSARKATMRTGQSIKRTIEEAKLLLGSSGLADVNSARQLRKHPAPVVVTTSRRVHKKGAGRPKKSVKTGTSSSGAPADANNVSADNANTSSD